MKYNPALKISLALAILSAPAIATSSKVDKFQQELNCLKANIFFEARGESTKGKLAVGAVTANRVKSKRYPDSVCKVVFQSKQFSWVHQLKWSRIQAVLDGNVKKLKKADMLAYQESKNTAGIVLVKGTNVLPSNVLHYHADYAKPKWADKSKRYAKIDRHIFYKDVK